MRKQGNARSQTSRQGGVALLLLCLLFSCLNPRPEELPSSSPFEPAAGDRRAAPEGSAEAAPTAAGIDEDSSDDITADPALQAPEPPPQFAAPPPDAGANADVEVDAGVEQRAAPDAG